MDEHGKKIFKQARCSTSFGDIFSKILYARKKKKFLRCKKKIEIFKTKRDFHAYGPLVKTNNPEKIVIRSK